MEHQVLAYENLIYSIIQKYRNHFDLDDLYQVAMMGLVQASKNFDEHYQIKFSTYAFYYITGEVNKYIRESSMIKTSKDLIQLNRSIEKAKDLMMQKLGREPSITEISLFLEVDEEKILQAQQAISDVKSLDYIYSDDGCELYNSVQSIEQGMDADILDLRNEITNLPKEEKELILARYYGELSQSETSQKLGMSQAQVSRNEAKILQKLKQRL